MTNLHENAGSKQDFELNAEYPIAALQQALGVPQSNAMLIPQFSLRWMLAVMTGLAVVFLIVSRAVQGSAWAVGASAAVAMLVFVVPVHLGLFFLVWLVSLRPSRRQMRAVAPASATVADATSPFQDASSTERSPDASHRGPS